MEKTKDKRSENAKKVAAAKSKGRAFQKSIANKIIEAFSGLSKEDAQSQTMSNNGEDIILSKKARDLLPFSFECKYRNKIGIVTWFKQAQKNTPEGCIPAVVSKVPHGPCLVTIDIDVFLTLVGGRIRGDKGKEIRDALSKNTSAPE